MKSATQLQAEIDAMFPSARPLLKYRNNAEGYVIVPAAHYAKLDEDRALWDYVEAGKIDVYETRDCKWVADTHDGNCFHGSTPREAVAKAVEAIEEGE